MKKALVLYAHPNPAQSRANRIIIDNLKGLESVTVNDLYEKYPYFHIDVKKEKELILQNELIVFQHPFYWYSMPPLMKMWVDEVLDYGFAYGPNGDQLKNKSFLLSITAGGALDRNLREGQDPLDIESFFTPYKHMAQMCGMKWVKPLILHGSQRTTEDEILLHAENIRKRLVEWCVHV